MAEDPDETILAREDEDDYDLLTYGEAGARVTEEIAAEKARLADWELRLAAGEDVAAQRNARPPITDENFERFFGYRGSAKRNT